MKKFMDEFKAFAMKGNMLDLTFTDKKEQSLAIIIVARLFRSQSRKASVVL